MEAAAGSDQLGFGELAMRLPVLWEEGCGSRDEERERGGRANHDIPGLTKRRDNDVDEKTLPLTFF